MHERDRQTDGQTDTGPQQKPRLRIASRGKNADVTKVNTFNASTVKCI